VAGALDTTAPAAGVVPRDHRIGDHDVPGHVLDRATAAAGLRTVVRERQTGDRDVEGRARRVDVEDAARGLTRDRRGRRTRAGDRDGAGDLLEVTGVHRDVQTGRDVDLVGGAGVEVRLVDRVGEAARTAGVVVGDVEGGRTRGCGAGDERGGRG